MTKVTFIGEKDFTDIFNSFGFETITIDSLQEAREVLKDSIKQYSLICLQRKYSDALDTVGPTEKINVVLLSEKLDEESIIKDFKRISEKATGVDLTNKL